MRSVMRIGAECGALRKRTFSLMPTVSTTSVSPSHFPPEWPKNDGSASSIAGGSSLDVDAANLVVRFLDDRDLAGRLQHFHREHAPSSSRACRPGCSACSCSGSARRGARPPAAIFASASYAASNSGFSGGGAPPNVGPSHARARACARRRRVRIARRRVALPGAAEVGLARDRLARRLRSAAARARPRRAQRASARATPTHDESQCRSCASPRLLLDVRGPAGPPFRTCGRRAA